MAIVVTLTIAEADIADVVKAVCTRAGLAVENTNAKPALKAIVSRWVTEERHLASVVSEPTIT